MTKVSIHFSEGVYQASFDHEKEIMSHTFFFAGKWWVIYVLKCDHPQQHLIVCRSENLQIFWKWSTRIILILAHLPEGDQP